MLDFAFWILENATSIASFFFTCFNGIIQSIAKNSTDVKRLYKIHSTGISSCIVELIFPLFFMILFLYVKNTLYLREQERKDKMQIAQLQKQFDYYRAKQKDEEKVRSVYQNNGEDQGIFPHKLVSIFSAYVINDKNSQNPDCQHKKICNFMSSNIAVLIIVFSVIAFFYPKGPGQHPTRITPSARSAGRANSFARAKAVSGMTVYCSINPIQRSLGLVKRRPAWFPQEIR